MGRQHVRPSAVVVNHMYTEMCKTYRECSEDYFPLIMDNDMHDLADRFLTEIQGLLFEYRGMRDVK